ncbi:MAG: (d)CMP kinase [Coriobacteriia bacterium]
MLITIDGPPGCGKSSLASHLANFYFLKYISSGAFYRLAALSLTDADLRDQFWCWLGKGDARVLELLDNHRASSRSMSVNRIVCDVARDETLRAAVNRCISQFVHESDCVVDGRDMGNALPEADVKFLIAASPEQQARIVRPDDETVAELQQRYSRELKFPAPPDAHLVNLLQTPQEESFARVRQIIERKTLLLRGPGGTYCGPRDEIRVVDDRPETRRRTEGASVILVRADCELDPHEMMRLAGQAPLAFLLDSSLEVADINSDWVRIVASPNGPILYGTRSRYYQAPTALRFPSVLCDSSAALSRIGNCSVIALRMESPEFASLLSHSSANASVVLVRLADERDGSGMRGAERMLQEPSAIMTQVARITALVRNECEVGILVPFVRSVQEGRAIAAIVRQSFEGPLGVMLEVPLALFHYRDLVQYFDFSVVGIGDLTNRLAAAPRTDKYYREQCEAMALDLLERYVKPYATDNHPIYCTSPNLTKAALDQFNLPMEYLHKPLEA